MNNSKRSVMPGSLSDSRASGDTSTGPQVMKGYWNHADEDAKVFVDGRVRTGDVGVLDADGYLQIVDRLKDIISVGGFQVFPSQRSDERRVGTVCVRTCRSRECLYLYKKKLSNKHHIEHTPQK